MSAGRRIFWNTTLLLGGDALRLVLGFVLTPVMARTAGSAGLGLFSYVMSLVGILAVVTDFGLSGFYVREAQRGGADRLAPAVLGLRAVIGTLSGIGLAAYGLSVEDSALSTLLVLGAVMLLLGVIPGHVAAILRAREQMGFEAVVKVAGVVVSTGGGVVALLRGWGVVGVMGVMTAFSAAMAAASLWIAPRLGYRPRLRTRDGAYLDVMRGAGPFAALAILVVIYFRADAVMLFAIRGREAAGQYAAAYRLMEAALLLPLAFAGAALPALTRGLAERRGETLAASIRALHLLAAASIPGAVFGAILAPHLFTLLYGSGFGEAAAIFRILAFTLVAVFASAVTSSLITASRPIINTYLAAIMVALNIGMNALLIPRWGGAGAAVATLATESVGLVLGAVYLRKRIGPLPVVGVMTKPAAAAVTVGVAMLLYPSIIALPVYAAAYLGMLWLIGGVDQDDMAFLRRLVASRPEAAPPAAGA